MSNELYTNSDGTDQDDRTDPDSYDICNTGFVHLFDGLNQSIQPQISKHVYNHWLITKKSTFLLADDEEGILRTDRSPVDPPADTDELILDLYRRLPEVRITDLLLEVDRATGFTDAFTHLRTGAPCKDLIGLLNVLLA